MCCTRLAGNAGLKNRQKIGHLVLVCITSHAQCHAHAHTHTHTHDSVVVVVEAAWNAVVSRSLLIVLNNASDAHESPARVPFVTSVGRHRHRNAVVLPVKYPPQPPCQSRKAVVATSDPIQDRSLNDMAGIWSTCRR